MLELKDGLAKLFGLLEFGDVVIHRTQPREPFPKLGVFLVERDALGLALRDQLLRLGFHFRDSDVAGVNGLESSLERGHVAVVCDQRVGGSIQFYIDGKPDRKHRLYALDMPVNLTGVRLGGYNVWEKNAGGNFHGSIDDVRVYRGTLLKEQVGELTVGEVLCSEGAPAEVRKK